jgi:L-lactate utilization protein LutB
MNQQEAFDKLWNHFVVKGGKQSLESPTKAKKNDNEDHVPYCLYRGAGGARCAVGVLLTDDVIEAMKKKFPKNWNSQESEKLMSMPSVKKLFKEMDDAEAFLGDAQSVHDKQGVAPARFTAHMRTGLKRLAATWKLTVPKSK